MTALVDPGRSMEMATEIVVAFLARRAVEPWELPDLVVQVRRALVQDTDDLAAGSGAALLRPSAHSETEDSAHVHGGEEPAALSEKVRQLPNGLKLEDTVTDEYIVCLEDGLHFRSLRRHLHAHHELTPDQYRQKWGLAADYPMVARSYAMDRSKIAKRIGLGKIAPAPARATPASKARRRKS